MWEVLIGIFDQWGVAKIHRRHSWQESFEFSFREFSFREGECWLPLFPGHFSFLPGQATPWLKCSKDGLPSPQQRQFKLWKLLFCLAHFNYYLIEYIPPRSSGQYILFSCPPYCLHQRAFWGKSNCRRVTGPRWPSEFRIEVEIWTWFSWIPVWR